ncbi:MAG: glycosyltransferase [Dolichospermum sp.]|jgi:spore maturation protein CgeB
MSYKIANLTTFYGSYLHQFYQINPDLKKQKFVEQQNALFADLFGWSDFLAKNFIDLGYEAIQIVGNAEFNQKQWAVEYGYNYVESNWIYDIVKAQIKQFEPDILFIEDSFTFSKDFIQEIKAENPNIKLVIIYICVDFNDLTAFKASDVVITCTDWIYKKLKNENVNAFLIKHGFEKSILQRIDQNHNKNHDLSFVGNLFPSHKQRYELIEKLAQKVNISIWTPSLNSNIYSLLKSGVKSLVTGNIKKYLEQEINMPLRYRYQGQAFGKKMYEIISQSKITLNNHIDDAKNEAANMRLFEATGVGTCLLTDWKDNLPELFEPEKEVVTYKSVEECIEKVKWLLDHPQEREAIAKAGQVRTLKDHTFAQRAIQLDEIIRKMI